MKKILLFITILFTAITFAQVPQGISYQAIALNSSGNPVVNAPVGVRLSVVDNAATGNVLYTETHVKTTNSQGLFNVVIGQGTPVTGTFAGINWGTNSKFLKAEIDVNGGTNYVLVGSTQLLLVPYAMYAGKTANVSAESLSGIGSNALKSTSFVIIDGTTVKGFYNGTWSTQTFSNQIYASDIIESNGNFTIIDGSSVKGFANGVWSIQSFSDQVYASNIIVSNEKFIIIDGSTVKGFSNGAWTTQTFSGQIYASDVIASNGDFIIIDGSTVKGFSNGAWSTQAFSGQIYTSDVVASNGNFVIIDGSTVKGYTHGIWSSQTFSGQVYPSDILSSEKN